MPWHTLLMEIANVVFRLLAASQVLLFLGLLMLSSNPSPIRLVGSALMAGIISYLLAPLVDQYTSWSILPLLWLPATLVPGLLLWFVWLVCEDECSPPRWIISLLLAFFAVSAWANFAHFGLLIDHDDYDLVQLIKVATVAAAVYVLWQGRDSDLVELRIKLRNVLMLVISLTAMVIVLVEFYTNYSVPLPIEVTGMGLIFISSFLANLYFIRLNPGIKLIGVPTIPRENSGDEMIKTLLQRMQSERLYADHDLRVAGLADILGVPEYQLRKRINRVLGYRNFNQFVNRYRIKEAGERLIADIKTPVLTIALDVGFRSISSFNTAFQAHFGESPTRYRAAHQVQQ